MSFNRIQKLLFAEYRDFEDMVLVESPFAQTTREGEGLRQVHLGLTPTKLILAVDILPNASDIYNVFQEPDVDPMIETLELVAIYPVECVNLSVFRRRKRQSLKARFCNNSIAYFELGGFEKRKMFWNLWCERVRFLNPDDNRSIMSETSVATSTSISTLRLLESKCTINENGKRQIWMKYDCNDRHCRSRTHNLKNQIIRNGFDFPKENESIKDNNTSETRSLSNGTTLDQNVPKRFNSLPAYKLHKGEPAAYYNVSSSSTTSKTDLATALDFKQLLEIAVCDWELSKACTVQKIQKINSIRGRHPRRYAVAPQPHFHYGLGPWNLHAGDRFSVQIKRSASAVRIRKPPIDSGLSISISKKLLTSSISVGTLAEKFNTLGVNKLMAYKKPILYFWTPEYWYRPQVVQDAYWEYLEHMKKLKNYFDSRKKWKPRKMSEEEERINDAKEFRKIFDNIQGFGKDFSQENIRDPHLERYLSATQYMRRKLKISIISRAWDFDSSRLAYQLTMIDKCLFMKIEDNEIEALTWQHCPKNAPNINAIIAFSHRISCLVATEILREESLQMRARLIVRFINVAQKCKELNNFQSCISILNGLQSVPIYRLHYTWAHLRKYHSLKYLLFEALCRECNDVRSFTYQSDFHYAVRNPPFLPCIADFFIRIFRKPAMASIKSSTNQNNINNKSSSKEIKVIMANRDMRGSGDNKPYDQIKNEKSLTTNRVADILSTIRGWRTSNLKKSKNTFTIAENYQEEVLQNHQNLINKKSSTRKIIKERFNWDREQRKINLEKTIEFLHVCKEGAKIYALTTSDSTKEYLLKARYREDRENFCHSCRLESEAL